MDRSKVILPVSIVLSAAIVGGFLYQIQRSKQASIEKQEEITQEAKKDKEIFDNNLKCQSLLKELKQRWNNVVGIYYVPPSENPFDIGPQNTCIVKYTKSGEVLEAPIEEMQDD